MVKEKIIVTGGAGFIGSHTVVELFQSGFEPVIVDDFSNSNPSVLEGIEEIIGENISFFELDCNDKEGLREVLKSQGKIAGIIHFAAFKAVGESVEDPLKYYHNNINSLVVLLDLIEELDIPRFVFSSSCTVYGEPDQLPVTENTPVKKAESPYGFTKVVGERIVQDFIHQNQIKKGLTQAVILRYFNPIGAHETGLIGELPLGTPNNLIPYLTQTVAGIREQLTVFGTDYNTEDGTCIRDYIHVVDLANAHVRALEWMRENSDSIEVFNIGTGQGNTVLEVINAFEEANGIKVNHIFGDRRSGDVEQIFANVDKSKTVLGWETQKDLKTALRDAWNWQIKLSKN